MNEAVEINFFLFFINLSFRCYEALNFKFIWLLKLLYCLIDRLVSLILRIYLFYLFFQ